MQSFDIVVVGGGMVGLSIVRLLRRYLPSASICLVERYSLKVSDGLYQPSFDQRSSALSADSVDIFDSLNIWGAIQQHVTAIKSVHVSDKGHVGTTSFRDTENHNEVLGYVVDNAWLGRCLAQGVTEDEGLTILAPAELQSLQAKRDGYELALTIDGEQQTLRSGLTIIADGADSQARTQLGIGVDSHDYRQSAVIANVSFEKPHNGVAYERFTDTGPIALLPLGGSDEASQASLVWTTPEAEVDDVLALSDDAFLEKLQARFGYRQGRFVKVGARAHYPLKRVVAKEQARSHLVLMGNAAHALHPVAGQGFNLALRDAEQFARCLARALDAGQALGGLSVLNSYVQRQYSDQWLTTMISHGFNDLFSDQRLSLKGIRNMGLLAMNICPPAKKLFFDQMMGKASLAQY